MNSVADTEARRNRAAASAARDDTAHPGAGGRMRALFGRLLSSARYERLEGSLRIARIEIERRFDPHAALDPIPSIPVDPRKGLGWKAAALALLAEAEGALASGKIDEGWKLLHAARRMEVFGMDEATELPEFAAMLRAESATKLGEWRRQAIANILGPALARDAPPAIDVTPAAVAQAALIRDEHFNNQGYKDQLIQTQILFLAMILAVVMAAIMTLLFQGRLPLSQAPTASPFYAFLAVMLFGNLGGTISAMLRASDTMAAARIPEITAANRVTLMRILMGGASAIVIDLVLQSGLTGVFNATVGQALGALKPQTVYVVAFVAGFTERLVLRAVEFVAGKEPPSGTTERKKN